MLEKENLHTYGMDAQLAIVNSLWSSKIENFQRLIRPRLAHARADARRQFLEK